MPKEMLPLGNSVVLQYVLRECDVAGLDSLLVVLNRSKTALFPVGEETECATDPVTGIQTRSVYFANQATQGGLAHALMHGEAFVGTDHFAVALGDTVIHGGEASLLARMVAAHTAHGAAATIAAQVIDGPEISRYGVFELDGPPGEVFRVRGIVEKPSREAAPSNLAITARYVFSPLVFEACRQSGPNAKGEIELTQAMSWLAAQGHPVLGVQLEPEQRRLDIGHPESYAAAFRLLSS
jgi:UTP--glucose-1-phosphate uridylyltransferase